MEMLRLCASLINRNTPKRCQHDRASRSQAFLRVAVQKNLVLLENAASVAILGTHKFVIYSRAPETSRCSHKVCRATPDLMGKYWQLQNANVKGEQVAVKKGYK